MMQVTPPPPVVVIQPGQQAQAFAAFPKVTQGEQHFIVLGINVTGDAKAVEDARLKLTAEGWPAEYITDRSGKKMLSIGAEKRTLAAVAGLMQRLKGQEFGDVTASFLAIPDPSFMH